MKSVSFSSIEEVTNIKSSDDKKGFVIFSNYETIKKLSDKVPENFVLCSTSGEYTRKGYEENAITGFEYDTSEVEIVGISYPPIKSVRNLKKAYEKIDANRNAFIMLLCDGIMAMEETVMTTLYFVRDDFKIIGGSAGDSLKFKETLIYHGKNKVHTIALFFNTKKRTEIIKENIYVPTEKRLLITEADAIKRTVKTLNNRPASTEYAESLGIKESELQEYFINNPLGKFNREDVYIASPMKVNSDKSITFYSQLMPNTFVQILKPIDPIEQVKNTIRKVSIKPSFILVINCVLRSLKFKQENLWGKFDTEMLNFCNNATGFVSYGEQFQKMHVNQTMVMLVVE